MTKTGLALLGLILGLSSVAPVAEARERPRDGVRAAGPVAHPQRGRASFYANRFHGRRMANGERFDRNSNSAASRSLPLGSRARVRNLENGRTAVVVIEDRGPHLRGRVLDVSPSTAAVLGMRRQGTAMVEITLLSAGHPNPG